MKCNPSHNGAFYFFYSIPALFEHATLLSIHHNQDVTEIIYIVPDPVFGFLLFPSLVSQALSPAKVTTVNHTAAKSMCFKYKRFGRGF